MTVFGLGPQFNMITPKKTKFEKENTPKVLPDKKFEHIKKKMIRQAKTKFIDESEHTDSPVTKDALSVISSSKSSSLKSLISSDDEEKNDDELNNIDELLENLWDIKEDAYSSMEDKMEQYLRDSIVKSFMSVFTSKSDNP